MVNNQNNIDRLQMDKMQAMLLNTEIVQDVEDEFVWIQEANETFTVKSCFKVLDSMMVVGLVTEEVRIVISFFWKMKAP